MHRMSFGLLSLLMICIPPALADWPYDQLPARALGYVEVRSIDGADTGMNALLEAAMGVSPGMGVTDWLAQQLGVHQLNGINAQAPAAMLLFQPEGKVMTQATVMHLEDVEAFRSSWASEGEEGSATLTTEEGVTVIETSHARHYLAVDNGYALIADTRETLDELVKAGHNWDDLFGGARPFKDGDLGIYVNINALRRLGNWQQLRKNAAAGMEACSPAGDASPELKALARVQADLALDLVEQVANLELAVDVSGAGLFARSRVIPEAGSPLAAFIGAQSGGTLDLFYRMPNSSMWTLATQLNPDSLLPALEAVFAAVTKVQPEINDFLDLYKQFLNNSTGQSAMSFGFTLGGENAFRFDQVHGVKDAAAARHDLLRIVEINNQLADKQTAKAVIPLPKYEVNENVGDYKGSTILNLSTNMSALSTQSSKDAELLRMLFDERLDYNCVAHDGKLAVSTGDVGAFLDALAADSVAPPHAQVGTALMRAPANKVLLSRFQPLHLLDTIALIPEELKSAMPFSLEGVEIPDSPGLWSWCYTKDNQLYGDSLLPIDEIKAVQAVWMQLMAKAMIKQLATPEAEETEIAP